MQVDAWMSQVDGDNSGSLSYEEFKQSLTTQMAIV